MTDAKEVVEAEKGDNLSPRNLHLRLRVVEWVVVISLVLNLAQWFVAGHNDRNLQGQVNDVRQETGVR